MSLALALLLYMHFGARRFAYECERCRMIPEDFLPASGTVLALCYLLIWPAVFFVTDEEPATPVTYWRGDGHWQYLESEKPQ
jgi:hypothetical protein